VNHPPGGPVSLNLVANYGVDDSSVLGSGRKKGRLAMLKNGSNNSPDSDKKKGVNNVMNKKVSCDNCASVGTTCSSTSKNGKSKMLRDKDLDSLKLQLKGITDRGSPVSPNDLASPLSSPSQQICSAGGVDITPRKKVLTLAEMVGDECSGTTGSKPATLSPGSAAQGDAVAVTHEEALFAAVASTRVTARGLPNQKLSPRDYSDQLQAQISTKEAIVKTLDFTALNNSTGTSAGARSEGSAATGGYNHYLHYMDDNYGRRKSTSSLHPMSPLSVSRQQQSSTQSTSELPCADGNSPIDKLLPIKEAKIIPCRRHDVTKAQYNIPFAHGDDTYDKSKQLPMQTIWKKGPGSPRSPTINLGWD
jgi:hypothetical protein